MDKRFKTIIFIASVFLIFGVGSFYLFRKLRDKSFVDEDKINIVVSILPQKEFVKAVGGEAVNVTELIHPGESPATYSLTPQDLIAIENADIYFRIGHIPFELSNIEKLKEINPDLKIVDISPEIELRYFTDEHEHEEVDYKSKCEELGEYVDWLEDFSECATQSSTTMTQDWCESLGGKFSDCESACRHDEESFACIQVCVSVCKFNNNQEHSDIEIDPHVWLSSENVMKMVEQIYDVLAEHDTDNASYYKSNALNYFNQLKSLDSSLKETLGDVAESKFLVFHPSWGYFADDYGLKQVAIEADGKEPTVEQIQNIVDLIKSEEIKVIFVQSQFSTKTAESIASDTGAVVISIDPLAENYIENMSKVGETIKDSLE